MSKRPGYMSPEIMGCQFSIYPLRQDDIGIAIRAAIEAVHSEGCAVRVGNLSTLISGNEDQVFAALRAAYRAAQRTGPAVMTAAFAAGMPSDELVDEIQTHLEGAAGYSHVVVEESAATGGAATGGAAAVPAEDAHTAPVGASATSTPRIDGDEVLIGGGDEC